MDIDGNNYNTVTIGTQVWMMSNLKVSQFNDGTAIAKPPTETVDSWSALATTPGYCFYQNSLPNKDKYGALYNWYVATNTKNVCPTGWLVPSENDFLVLTGYANNNIDDSSGLKSLKKSGNATWIANSNGNNAFGFTALPAGSVSNEGVFNLLNAASAMWSSTPYSSTQGEALSIHDQISANLYLGAANKNVGISIRCIKN